MMGIKSKIIYDTFIKYHLPTNIENYIYVEPFGGEFSISTYLDKKPLKLIYNDINKYDINIIADKIHYLDYKKIFKLYDSENTFFYLDPPYKNKEHFYKNCEHYNENFHIELEHEISNLKGDFLLSYNDDKFILKLYNNYNIIKYNGNRFSSKHEILIKKRF